MKGRLDEKSISAAAQIRPEVYSLPIAGQELECFTLAESRTGRSHLGSNERGNVSPLTRFTANDPIASHPSSDCHESGLFGWSRSALRILFKSRINLNTRWPATLWVVRHGQSAGNVARDSAHEAKLDRIAVDGRDVDVSLSSLGEEQSRALGRWFAGMAAAERPEAVLVSPYRRAISTAALIRKEGGLVADEPLCVDERLREKEFGILDGLTTSGVANVYPDQAGFRQSLGKFYHRPPGGESWTDVILRLRSFLDTVSLHHAGQRVLIVAHQVVVLCLRYILESLDEERILGIDREGDVANCSVTEYSFDPSIGKAGKLALIRYNYTVPLTDEAVPLTAAKDAPAGVRG